MTSGTNDVDPERAGMDVKGKDTFWTLPNVLTSFRLAAAPALVVVALLGWRGAAVGLFACMFLSDWLDGKLAILLRQRSRLGPRLDSVADVAMYTSLVLAVLMLEGALLLESWWWPALAGLSYAVHVAWAYVRFRTFPAYHTRAAKTSWLVVSVSALLVLLKGWSWPVIAASVAVAITNLEMIFITCVLSQPATDLPSLWHAWVRERGRGRAIQQGAGRQGQRRVDRHRGA